MDLKFLFLTMPISEKSSSSRSLRLSSVAARDIDPLLKDLNEKKQSFRRNVVSLAAELKEARSRLISQEQSFARETLTRQEAEVKARNMEEEIDRLQKRLEERNERLQASASTTEKYLNELDNLRTQIASTRAAAEASVASAQSADLQYAELVKELDEKNCSLREQEGRFIRMGEQLDNLQKDLHARESSQKQLKDEVMRIEQDVREALAKAGANKNCELRKILDEVSPRNLEKIHERLIVKDEEIAKLKDDIKIVSSHSKFKIEELESRLEKRRCVDQELKKRMLKLEFCLQEARSQTRKLHKMGERQDKAIKDLRDQLAAKQRSEVGAEKQNQNFWESSGFKIVASVSMLILVVFSKR